MADRKEPKRDDYDTGKAGGNKVGAFTGDTMATALDPFGSAAAEPVSALDNKAGEGTIDDDKHEPKNRDGK